MENSFVSQYMNDKIGDIKAFQKLVEEFFFVARSENIPEPQDCDKLVFMYSSYNFYNSENLSPCLFVRWAKTSSKNSMHMWFYYLKEENSMKVMIRSNRIWKNNISPKEAFNILKDYFTNP